MKLRTTLGLLVKKITAAALVLAALPAMAATQIVSQLPPSSAISTVGGGSSYDPIVTPDGRYVLFASTSANLVASPGGLQMPAAVPARMNVFLRDRQTGVTVLVSVNTAGTAGGNGDSFPNAISTNGQFAVFESAASNLVAGDNNAAGDIFVRDTVNNITTLVSVSTNGSAGNAVSRHAAITPDGLYVAFVSAASNLVAKDSNGIPDVFVRDLQLGVTTLASPGAQNSGCTSEWPILSADGRYVAFFSTAAGLVSNVTNSGELYVRDLAQGTTAWVSTNAYRLNSSAHPANYAMSANGQWIAYQATVTSTGIMSPSTGFVFRYNVATGTSDDICTNGWVMASLDTDGRNIDISADGRFVAFTMTNSSGGASIQLWDAQSGATSLISGEYLPFATQHCDFPRVDQTGRYVAFTCDNLAITENSSFAYGCHIYLRDTSTGAIQQVDVGTGALSAYWVIMTPFHLSAEGNAVAFDCFNGAPGINPYKFDAFLRDFGSNTTEVISVPAPTLPSDTPLNSSGLTGFSISSNGQFVAFASQSDGIVSGDTNGCQDVFVHDFATGSNTLVSVSVSGPWTGNGNSSEPAISADGRCVAFSSFATNLVTNDFNNIYGYSGIFLRDLQAGSTVLISKNYIGSGSANGSSFTPQISADGRRLLFVSLANNLTTNTSVTGSNLFWRDIQAGVTYAITTTGGVTVAVMTPDGSNVLFAVGTQLSLWNAGSHSTTNITTASSAVVDLAIGADAHRAAFVAGGSCYMTDLFAHTNWLLAKFVVPTSRTHCQFTGDSRFLAYLAWDGMGSPVHPTNQVYLYDFQNATSNLVSQSYNSTNGGYGPSDSPAISADGRLVAYRSAASNLVPGDANGVPDIFLYDRLTGGTTLVSASLFGGCAANGRSLSPVFSADDQTLFFDSWASDLVPDDFNDSSDVFALSLPAMVTAIAITANPTNGVVPLTVSFTSAGVDSAGNAITSWNWSFGDGSTSTAQNPSHTYTTPGAFAVTLIATGNNGLPIAGSTASITVSPRIVAFTANPTNGMVPLTVSFTSAGVDSVGNAITSWNWTFGDGSTSIAQNPSHTYTTPGTFTVALIATNDVGDTGTGSGPASITAYPASLYSGLVLNGGFETGDFTGWTLSGDTSYSFVDDGSEITPYSGNYEAALGTSGSLGYLSQTLSTTAGASYLLSFWLNNPYGDLGEFLVSWNGNTFLDTTNIDASGDWTNMQYVVSAAGTSTVLQFGFNDDWDYLGLDDISVSAISAPPLQLSSAGFSTNGGFQLCVGGQIGQAYTLQASTNLTSWVSILVFTCTNSPIYVADPTATNFSRRFYRLVQGTFLAPFTLGFGSAQPRTTNGLCLMLQGTMGANYVIQASTDLLNWQPVTNLAVTNSPLYFTDPTATNYNRRFYRSLVQ